MQVYVLCDSSFSRENLMQYYIASNPTWVGQERKKINISSKKVIFHFHLYALKIALNKKWYAMSQENKNIYN